jgi:hypothetical protein
LGFESRVKIFLLILDDDLQKDTRNKFEVCMVPLPKPSDNLHLYVDYGIFYDCLDKSAPSG